MEGGGHDGESGSDCSTKIISHVQSPSFFPVTKPPLMWQNSPVFVLPTRHSTLSTKRKRDYDPEENMHQFLFQMKISNAQNDPMGGGNRNSVDLRDSRINTSTSKNLEDTYTN
jgi:hypothetical protein